MSAVRIAEFRRDDNDGSSGTFVLTLRRHGAGFVIDSSEHFIGASGRATEGPGASHPFDDEEDADETFDVWVVAAIKRGWKPA